MLWFWCNHWNFFIPPLPYLYVRPCPETPPKNGRELTPGRPTCLPLLRTDLSLLSCPVIPATTPTTTRPRTMVLLTPPSLPCSGVITLSLGLCSIRIPGKVSLRIQVAVDATHGTKEYLTD